MDIKSVKQLAALAQEFDLAELTVKDGEFEVTISRGAAVAATPVAAPAPVAAAPAQSAPVAPAQAQAGAEEVGEALLAPLVGVAYLAAKPGAAPFVQVGQAVKQGQTLCILEAMKVMNEFPAPRDGVITAVCVENEDLVEFGQCLFRLQ